MLCTVFVLHQLRCKQSSHGGIYLDLNSDGHINIPNNENRHWGVLKSVSEPEARCRRGVDIWFLYLPKTRNTWVQVILEFTRAECAGSGRGICCWVGSVVRFTHSRLGTSGSYLDTLFSTRLTDFVFIALHCSFMCLGFHSILITLLEDLLGSWEFCRAWNMFLSNYSKVSVKRNNCRKRLNE